MIRFMLQAILVCATTKASIAGNPPPPDETLARLETVLQQYEQAGSALHTKMRLEELAPLPFSDAAWSLDSWKDAPAIGTRHMTWTAFDVRRALHIDRWAQRNTTDPSDATIDCVWNGTAFELSRQSNEETVRHLAPLPKPDPMHEWVSLFNGGTQWYSFIGPASLSERLGHFRFLESAKTDETTSYRFAMGEHPSSPELTVELTDGPEPRLHAIQIEMYVTANEERKLFGRKRLMLTSWERVDAVLLPTEAYYLQGRVPEEGEGSVLAIRIRREETIRLPNLEAANPLFATPPLHKGDIVVDECYGLSYKVGDAYVVAADLPIALAAPIEDLIGLVGGLARDRVTADATDAPPTDLPPTHPTVPRFNFSQGALQVREQAQSLSVIATTRSGIRPSTPSIHCPPGVECTFGNWKPDFADSENGERLYRWCALFEVRLLEGSTVADDAVMDVMFPGQPRAIRLSLTGRCAVPIPPAAAPAN